LKGDNRQGNNPRRGGKKQDNSLWRGDKRHGNLHSSPVSLNAGTMATGSQVITMVTPVIVTAAEDFSNIPEYNKKTPVENGGLCFELSL
jgi:hypothetical protein